MTYQDLDYPLMHFTNDTTAWTIRDAVEGVQIFGGIGSGKTSGSGNLLASKYLSAGFGGLVLTVKSEEKKLWEDYCKEANRSNDLIIVEAGGKHFFNFLEYESQPRENQPAITQNIVQVLKTVIQASEEKSSGKGDDRFWNDSLNMLLYNLVDLSMIAYGKVTVDLMYSIALTIPQNRLSYESLMKSDNEDNAFKNAYILAKRRISDQINEWENNIGIEKVTSFKSLQEYQDALHDDCPQVRTFKMVKQFIVENYIGLSEKTRNTIDLIFTSFFIRLLNDPIYSLFCKKQSTFTPEDSLNGKIILINLPIKLYDEVGRDIQIMFKYVWQRAMERRNITNNARPVFLWADEAQNFIHEHDANYQATARSSRIATVYLSQNIHNYYGNMGGLKYEHKVLSFLGTLATKIFHANADSATNKYASELIGDDFFLKTSTSTSYSKDFNFSESEHEELRRIFIERYFLELKTGGEPNNFLVEGILVCQGKKFNTGYTSKLITFIQSYKNQKS